MQLEIKYSWNSVGNVCSIKDNTIWQVYYCACSFEKEKSAWLLGNAYSLKKKTIWQMHNLEDMIILASVCCLNSKRIQCDK
jgi:hypothetical protein